MTGDEAWDREPGNMSNMHAYTPVVTPHEDASSELVAIGREYWSLVGFSEDNRPQWKTTVKQIDTQGLGAAHVVAAAGVRAELADTACADCERPVGLTSRASLDAVIAGRAVSCIECDEQLQDRIVQLRTPDDYRERERREKQEHKQQQAEYARGAHEWEAHLRHMVAEAYPTELHPDVSPPAADVEAELAALTVLRFAPKVAPATPVAYWNHDFPCHPRGDDNNPQLAELVHATRNEGLLVPDATTEIGAFVWEPARFNDAYEAAGRDIERVEMPRLPDRYRPLHVSWHVPYGPSPETAVQRLDEHLTARLDVANMSARRQQDLLEAADTALFGEAQRYFAHQLGYRNLPDVPDNHQPRLDEAVARALSCRPLGTVYYLAWLATKTAAASAHSQPRVPKAKMTTYAVNRFIEDTQRAVDDDSFATSVFEVPIGCPLSAFTRTLFYSVLETNPVTVRATTIAEQLPPPIVPAAAEPGQGERTPAADDAAFQTGTTTWVALSGTHPSTLLLRASEYLAGHEQTEQSRLLTSIQWDTTGDGSCVLTLYFDHGTSTETGG